ncbi:MAG: SulP family inorganic anion transporter [Planctomycetota bacterium]
MPSSPPGPTPPPMSLRQLGVAMAEPLISPLRRFGAAMRGYTAADARGDALAGLTVAVIGVPQAMAYALIAGVPAEYGLYTLIFQCAIGSIFNSQPLLSVGPINTQSLLVASIVSRLAGAMGPEYVAIAITLTFLKGLVQMAMAEMRLGNLVQYVSQSVIIGFTAGAGVLIAAKQVSGFLGFDVTRLDDTWPGLIGIVQNLWGGETAGAWGHLDETSAWAVGLGVLSLAIVIGSRMISRFVPGPLIAVAVAATAVWAVGLNDQDLTLVGEVPTSLAGVLSAPDFTAIVVHFDALLAGALALALLGLMEAYSIGKNIAGKTGSRISANQEMFSQGLTNFLTSFLSCIPGSGSFSRSALNHYAGAKTAVSGLFNAGFVLIIFLLFAPAAKYIPMSCIAAILFVVAYGLIDWKHFLRLVKANPADGAVCLATFVATLFAPLQYAVFLGIALNLALYLRRAAQLQMSEMVKPRGGPFVERPLRVSDGSAAKEVMMVQLEGSLFFAGADELQDRLSDIERQGVRVVILRMKRTHSVDATVMAVLERFVESMQARGGHVVLCGLKETTLQRLDAYGLVARIGKANVFPTTYGVFESARRALERARELLGATVDLDGLLDEEEPKGVQPLDPREDDGRWAYQI